VGPPEGEVGTLVTAVLAAGVSVLWWSGNSLEVLLGGPWRLLAATLPHVNVLHLVFNLWWLIVFGTEVEAVFGSLRTLALFVLLAAGSSAWQEALAGGGVGLSGVGYGLFGMLWVLSGTDRRFRGVVDRGTVETFVGWFLLCCLLTGLGVWRVGNVAHGSGAVLGALVGAALSRGVRRRLALGGAAAVFLAVGIAGFVHPVPLAWMGAQRGILLERQAYLAQREGRNEEAVKLYGEVIALDPGAARCFYNRGIACQSLHRWKEALADYREAARLEPSKAMYREAAEGLSRWLNAGGK
jgi:GlpG protein